MHLDGHLLLFRWGAWAVTAGVYLGAPLGSSE